MIRRLPTTSLYISCLVFCFFFNDTATTEIYTLSLHDALPIFVAAVRSRPLPGALALDVSETAAVERAFATTRPNVAFLAVNVPGGVDRCEDHPDEAYEDRKSTRLNSSHDQISYAVFCLKKKEQRTDINTLLDELNPLFPINVTMRDIKSKNVYSRVNSKATTQWRKTESANGVHLEGVASDNRSS